VAPGSSQSGRFTRSLRASAHDAERSSSLAGRQSKRPIPQRATGAESGASSQAPPPCGRVRLRAGVRAVVFGVSDSTAIWFIQCAGRERRLVDYYESSGVGLDHYVDVLHDKRRKYGWAYGEHFFPHDIKVREFTSGKSRLNTLAGLGIEATVVPQYDELDGINVVRRMLGRMRRREPLRLPL
jgi:hypothetical protein